MTRVEVRLPMTGRVVHDYGDLAAILRGEREGRTVALTNGCFDVLHVGHVRLIRDAVQEADLLVVALNSDASVRANKGPGRPYVPLAERMEVIAALRGVDFVTSFAEPTADDLLAALRPEVHVKGTDWTDASVPERDVVIGYGGRIAICGDEKTHSSSAILERLEGDG